MVLPKARDASFLSFTGVTCTAHVPQWPTIINRGVRPSVFTKTNGGIATAVKVLDYNRMMEFFVCLCECNIVVINDNDGPPA